MTTRLYHRSDVTAVTTPISSHDFSAKKDRHPAPVAWDPERSLPVIETDDAGLLEHLRAAGWTPHPSKVGLTPDEEERKKEYEQEGDAITGQMARAFGEAAAGQVAAARRGAAPRAPRAKAAAKPKAAKAAKPRAPKAPVKALAKAAAPAPAAAPVKATSKTRKAAKS